MENVNLVIEIFFLSLPYLCRDTLKEAVLAYVLQKSLGIIFLCMKNHVRATRLGNGYPPPPTLFNNDT